MATGYEQFNMGFVDLVVDGSYLMLHKLVAESKN